MSERPSRSERLSVQAYSKADKLPLRLVLDNIRSGQNVGACFRSADAFRIEGLDLCGITCHPPHRDILKSALGASDHVSWRAHDDALLAIRELQEAGWKVAAVEQAVHSTPLHAWQPQSHERWALVLGNEVRGVSQEVLNACDLAVEMPQYGVKQSINVSVCAGVVLWQAALHMRHGA